MGEKGRPRPRVLSSLSNTTEDYTSLLSLVVAPPGKRPVSFLYNLASSDTTSFAFFGIVGKKTKMILTADDELLFLPNNFLLWDICSLLQQQLG